MYYPRLSSAPVMKAGVWGRAFDGGIVPLRGEIPDHILVYDDERSEGVWKLHLEGAMLV